MLLFYLLQMGANSSRTTSLKCIKKKKMGQVWSPEFNDTPGLLLWYWMATVSFGRQRTLTYWRILIITVLQLDQFCRKQEKWVEVTYVLLFITLWDVSDLCLKGTDLGVKPSAASCPLTLPLYLGLPNAQAEIQGTLTGGVASVSVEIQTVPIVVETIRRIQEVHRNLYGTSFTLWAFLERCNVCIGVDADSWLKNLSFGEAPTFGDEWLEHETRRKREHKIALLPTGSQAVTMTEPDWDCDMAKERWDQNHFARCILEGLKQAHTETLNYAKLADIEQGEKETPRKFLDRVRDPDLWA